MTIIVPKSYIVYDFFSFHDIFRIETIVFIMFNIILINDL